MSFHMGVLLQKNIFLSLKKKKRKNEKEKGKGKGGQGERLNDISNPTQT